MLLNFAFMAKLPIFPLHSWLPKAHVEASVVGSIILAGVLLKLGGVGVIRLQNFFNFYSLFEENFLVRLRLYGGVIRRVVCLRQCDIKALVAYSSIGHMRLVFVGSLRFREAGLYGIILLIITHGLCSAGLFFVVNVLYEFRGSRSLVVNVGVIGVLPRLRF